MNYVKLAPLRDRGQRSSKMVTDGAQNKVFVRAGVEQINFYPTQTPAIQCVLLLEKVTAPLPLARAGCVVKAVLKSITRQLPTQLGLAKV